MPNVMKRGSKRRSQELSRLTMQIRASHLGLRETSLHYKTTCLSESQISLGIPCFYFYLKSARPHFCPWGACRASNTRGRGGRRARPEARSSCGADVRDTSCREALLLLPYLAKAHCWGAGQFHPSHFKTKEKEEFCQQSSVEWNRPDEWFLPRGVLAESEASFGYHGWGRGPALPTSSGQRPG